MTWNQLVVDLRTHVDWRTGDYLESEGGVVQEILQRHLADQSLITERVQEILGDEDLLEQLSANSNYPRTPMDKFVLHMDESDAFRLRVHRFWPQETSGCAIEKVHYHKWDMTTMMLRGEYVEERYSYDRDNPSLMPTLSTTDSLGAGESQSLAAGVPHRVVNYSAQEPAVTFFVRGPSKLPAARIFDTDDGTYWDTFDPKRQMREGFKAIGSLDPFFHPVLRPGDR